MVRMHSMHLVHHQGLPGFDRIYCSVVCQSCLHRQLTRWRTSRHCRICCSRSCRSVYAFFEEAAVRLEGLLRC
jgi:hypothetical protein